MPRPEGGSILLPKSEAVSNWNLLGHYELFALFGNIFTKLGQTMLSLSSSYNIDRNIPHSKKLAPPNPDKDWYRTRAGGRGT